jgi:hypothetical protein
MERLTRIYNENKFSILVATSLVSIASSYYLSQVVEKPKVYFKPKEDENSSSVIGRIVEKLDILNRHYYPTFWCVCDLVFLFD